jgi:ketol-acid reductoisomerase
LSDARLYFDKDADLSVIDGKTIAIVGYGNQGRSQALNIRDTNPDVKVIIGNIEDEYRDRAQQDGFEVCDISDACKRADIILLLIPDETMHKVYKEEIERHLTDGKVLCFASGYCVNFHLIEPPRNVDVILVGPRMGGKEVRDLYLSGNGFPSFIAVKQDASTRARRIALAIAKAIGSTKGDSVVVEVTFEQETLSDLLSEQALSPLIVAAWIAKYEVDLENGVPPEAALLELHLSGEWAEDYRRMAEMGIVKQLPLHSKTSQYGQLTRLDLLLTGKEQPSYKQIKAFVQRQAERIRNGEFSREWASEQERGYANLRKLYDKYENSPMITEEQKTLKRIRPRGARHT